MTRKLEKVLFHTAALTFEKLGFMFLMPELEKEQNGSSTEFEASVQFQGPFRGSLTVAVCRNLMPKLAANMLGEDELPSKQQQMDALGEIANVICGNVLPNVAGRGEVFEIGAPQVTCSTKCSKSAQPSVGQARLSLEEGRADVRLCVEGNAKMKGLDQ